MASAYLIRQNLEIEHDIGRNSVVSLGYAGSRGVNLFGNADTNLAMPEIRPDGSQFFADSTRRNPNYDEISTASTRASTPGTTPSRRACSSATATG